MAPPTPAPAVALVAKNCGQCPLLRSGDRWVVNEREITAPSGSRLCAAGISNLYPKVKQVLKILASGAPVPRELLLCEAANCRATFALELTAPSGEPVLSPRASQRLGRRATIVARMLTHLGPFMLRLPSEVASELLAVCHVAQYKAGKVILLQGVQGERLYIVAEGSVQVVRKGANDEETALLALGVGECFGEMSILTGEPTSAEVRSVADSTILAVPREQLEALLLRHPVLSREFSKLLATRLNAANESFHTELRRGILGKLSMISLADLIQTLHHSRRSGVLTVQSTRQKACIYFQTGTLVGAQVDEKCAEEAVYHVIGWPEGDFCFEPQDVSPAPVLRVRADTFAVVLEGLRRMDEKRAQGESSDRAVQAD